MKKPLVIMVREKQKTIGTRDVNTAAFLAAKGNKVLGTSRDGRDVVIHFAPSPQIDADIEDWKFGDALINARTFSAARRYVLDLVHQNDGCKS